MRDHSQVVDRPFVAGARRQTRPVVVVACLLLAAACGDGAADEALGDRLAESIVESLRKRAMDRHRGDLPLPGDELLIEVDIDRQRPDESFRVDLVDDLVIGERGDDANYFFGRLGRQPFSLHRIAVDDAGRIYVLHRLRRVAHVRVYGPDGEFLHRFGRWGEGPGDFLYPRWLIVAGGQVLVFHYNTDWSIWDRGGHYRRDRRVFPAVDRDDLRRVRPSKRVLAATGLDDGSVVMMSPGITASEVGNPFAGVKVTLSRFDAAGNETKRYFSVPEKAQPRLAVSPGGDIYASFGGREGGEYYVVAWTADGTPRWFTSLEPPDGDARWAELRLDGDGHLYVMPSYRTAPDEGWRPVYVLTTEGRFIGSGYLSRGPEKLHWQAARDGKVYGVRQNETTREWEIVRYRVDISSAVSASY